MSTSPFSFEKKPELRMKTDGPLGAGRLATGSQFVYMESISDHDRHQPTFLELEKPRGTEIVDMNQSGHVVAAPGTEQRIGTFGLGGCTAVGVVATFSDGQRRAYVQHYDPFAKRMDANVPGSLEEALLSNEAHEGNYAAADKVNAVIMTPGLTYTDPKDPEHVGWLTETIRRDFGEDTQVDVMPYSKNQMSGQSLYTTALIIDVPATSSPEIFPGMSRIQTGQ